MIVINKIQIKSKTTPIKCNFHAEIITESPIPNIFLIFLSAYQVKD